MKLSPPSGDGAATDFQKAAATAYRRQGAGIWFTLTVSEQAKAIYAELRRIDAERVTALLSRPPRSLQRVSEAAGSGQLCSAVASLSPADAAEM